MWNSRQSVHGCLEVVTALAWSNRAFVCPLFSCSITGTYAPLVIYKPPCFIPLHVKHPAMHEDSPLSLAHSNTASPCADEDRKITRRSHRKSRAGCKNCKTRRIKVRRIGVLIQIWEDLHVPQGGILVASKGAGGSQMAFPLSLGSEDNAQAFMKGVGFETNVCSATRRSRNVTIASAGM